MINNALLRRLALVLFITLLPLRVSAISLDAILHQMDDGPGVQASLEQQRLLGIERNQRRDEAGWSVFGGADIGYFRELEATGRADYTGYGAQLGLRYPLLGTLKARQAAVNDGELAVRQAREQETLRRMEQRFAVRLAYIDWWQVQETRQWCESLQQTASDERQRVNIRADNQSLRHSEQLWLEQRWRQLLSSCDRLEGRETVSRQRLARISGLTMPESANAEPVSLLANPAPAANWLELIDRHPAIRSDRLAAVAALNAPDHRWHDQIDANFTLAQRLDWRNDLPGTGSGLAAGVTFEVPLAALGSRGRDSLSGARYRVANEQAKDTRWDLLTELENTLTRYQDQLAALENQQQMVSLNQQVTAERQQRLAVDGEAGFMALRSAIAEEADARLQLLNHWQDAWRSQAQLHLLTESQPLPATGFPRYHDWRKNPDMAEVGTSSGTTWSKAVYLWQSHDLINLDSRDDIMPALQANGFQRIYLGLDAGQISDIDALTPRLSQLLQQLRQAGMAVDLLLGEPLWITEEHRQDLVQLLRKVSHLPFDHLHLDLEVEQLGWPVTDDWLQGWLDTLQAAVTASPWPVTVVSHYRWFAPPQSRDREEHSRSPCIPCQLPALGITGASLMIYSTNENSVAERTAGIVETWPEINFKLAQSTEASLPPENSWHGKSGQELDALGKRMESRLSVNGLTGIEWQDWSGYPAFRPQQSKPTPSTGTFSGNP